MRFDVFNVAALINALSNFYLLQCLCFDSVCFLRYRMPAPKMAEVLQRCTQNSLKASTERKAGNVYIYRNVPHDVSDEAILLVR